MIALGDPKTPLPLAFGNFSTRRLKIPVALIFCDFFFFSAFFLGLAVVPWVLWTVAHSLTLSPSRFLSLHLAKCTFLKFTLYVGTKCLTKNMVMYSTKALCTKYSLRVLKRFFFFSFMSVGSCFTMKQVSERDEDTFYFEIKASSEM